MLQHHHHQIAQSPARLGLTSPTSSSPNPTTNTNKQQQQTLSIPTATTSSSTLLPLLPPLPRAQTLLLQLSLLSSKLFEVSPNRSLWVSSFRGNLPSFLQHQSHDTPLPTLDSPVTNTKELVSQFSQLQSRLFDTVAELQEVLHIQDGVKRVGSDVKGVDLRLVEFAKRLREVERVLDALVDDYQDFKRDDRTTVESKLNLSDVLSYAHRISYTTFAPPEFGAGQAPLRGALPPAPQDEQMRASQLYAFADLDVGVPKRGGLEGKDKVIEPIIEATPAPSMSEGGLQGILPPKIEVPSGWKPGMPVELPADIPLMPPGWKPGDPIPLPPFDALTAGSRAQEQQFRPLPPQGMHRPPGPIQVAPVQLDIDADDSSEYSGSDVSSDEDD